MKVGGLQRTIIADPNAVLAQARQLLASDPGAAEAQARLLLTSYPDNPATFRLLGQALRRLDRRDEAASAEQQALAVSGRSPTPGKRWRSFSNCCRMIRTTSSR